MSSFLTLVSRPEFQAERSRLFRHGVKVFRDAKDRVPRATAESDWASCVAFPRLNGTGGGLVSGDPTGTWLTAPGTLFHASGIRSGDEPALLKRYLEAGAETLARELQGFFAIVIGDARTRDVRVITDLVGSYHVYVRSWEHGVALSSSSLALASLGPVTLDPVACQEFLRVGSMYEDRTFYREIRKLAPATIYRFPASGARSEEPYWALGNLSPDRYHGHGALTQLEGELVGAARLIGKAFSKPVCDLTGGYDSRAVCASFRKAGVPFDTVVSGFPDSHDVTVSKGLAHAAGLEHTYIPTTAPVTWAETKRAFTVTDGEYDLAEYGIVFRNHEMLLQRYDVTVNGSFGEMSRGISWEVLFPNIGTPGPLDARKVAARRFAATSSDALAFPERLDLVSHFAGIIQRANAGLERTPNTFQMDHVHLRLRMQRWQGRIASSTDQLWPCLSHYMLRPVLETVLQIRARDRKHSGLARHLLVDLDPLFASYPMEHGYPPLPVTVWNLHRFWPVPIYYGERVWAKLFPSKRAATHATPNGGPPHLQLSQLGEVRDLLRPDTMRMASLVGKESLTRFLQARGAEGRYDQAWTRVLSLEFTLRTLERLGRP